MSITSEVVFLVSVWLMITYLVALPFFFIAVALLMPKEILQRYFREPYFSRSEQIVYTATPFSYMRVISMAWLIAFPRFGKKRGMTDVHAHCPAWYARLSQVFVCWLLGHAVVALLLMFGVIFYMWLTE